MWKCFACFWTRHTVVLVQNAKLKMPCWTLDPFSGTHQNIWHKKSFRFNGFMFDICKSSKCLKPPLHCLRATANTDTSDLRFKIQKIMFMAGEYLQLLRQINKNAWYVVISCLSNITNPNQRKNFKIIDFFQLIQDINRYSMSSFSLFPTGTSWCQPERKLSMMLHEIYWIAPRWHRKFSISLFSFNAFLINK